MDFDDAQDLPLWNSPGERELRGRALNTATAVPNGGPWRKRWRKKQLMLGFDLDVWDYVTFAALLFIGVVFLGVLIFLLGLPGRIAIARKHPEADAVYFMGWVGFIAVVPWIQALIWAFKPTDVIDLRYLPRDVERETAAAIARLSGKTPPGDPAGPHGGTEP